MRAIINSTDHEDSVQVPKYRVTRLRRQIHRPSFGNLGKLPPELLCMVFRHLTCDDLEALHSCSTGGRMAVLAFPQYHNLLRHAPTILAILKYTGLAPSFTIMEIYETFVSPLCTTCGQFGGFVFLPSFTRCCMHCADIDLKFLPISRDAARKEFGVKGKKIIDGLPKLTAIEGYYSTFGGEVKYYTHNLTLFSRELVKKMRDPNHVLSMARHEQTFLDFHFSKAHQRYMALTPLPCFIPKSASLETGVYCAGCAIRAKEHYPCEGSDMSEYREFEVGYNPFITDGHGFACGGGFGFRRNPCPLHIAKNRPHDSRQILSHLQSCVGAQALLKHKWTRLQKKLSERNT